MTDIPREKIEGVPSLFSLQDRVAVITGGSKGLGRGIGLAFAAAGAHVVPVSRTLEDLESVSEEIRSLGRRSIPVVADVTLDEPVEEMVRKVMEEFGGIDILVANAANRSNTPFENLSWEIWKQTIDISIHGAFIAGTTAFAR